MEANVNALAALARTIELQRKDELRQELQERRAFEALGLDYGKVLEARRLAAQQRLSELSNQPPIPQQLNLPGINPTLMALRSAEPLSPEEMVAAGILPPWHRSSMPVGEQLELDLNVGAQAPAVAPANNVVPLVAPPASAGAASAGRRFAGSRLAQVAGAGGVGGVALIGALMQLLAAPSKEEPPERRS